MLSFSLLDYYHDGGCRMETFRVQQVLLPVGGKLTARFDVSSKLKRKNLRSEGEIQNPQQQLLI